MYRVIRAGGIVSNRGLARNSVYLYGVSLRRMVAGCVFGYGASGRRSMSRIGAAVRGSHGKRTDCSGASSMPGASESRMARAERMTAVTRKHYTSKDKLRPVR